MNKEEKLKELRAEFEDVVKASQACVKEFEERLGELAQERLDLLREMEALTMDILKEMGVSEDDLRGGER